jgi:hypothetical protein
MIRRMTPRSLSCRRPRRPPRHHCLLLDAEVDGGHAITIETAYLDLREQRCPLWSSALQLPLPAVADVRDEERDEDEKHIDDRLPPSRAANDDSLSLPPSSSSLPVTIPANGYQLILERLDALQTAFHSLQAAFDHHCIDHRVTLHRKRKRPADGSSEDGYETDRCYTSPSLASTHGSAGDTSPPLLSRPFAVASQQPSVDSVRPRLSPEVLREERAELVVDQQAENVRPCTLPQPSRSQSSTSVATRSHARPPPRHSSSAPSSKDHRRYDGWTFVSQQHGGMEWRLSYRTKGASAAIYIGTPLSPSHPVAVKVALDEDRPIDRDLVREAAMMQQVASSHPEAECQLYHQPAAGDAPPVFLAMTWVDCNFEELCRLRKPSPSALCEGLLLTLYALRSVHPSGVLHRDVKLNNVGFRISDAVRHPRSSSSSSPVFVRADGVRGVVHLRLSACMFNFGEAVPLRVGHQGPTDYGRCKSKYASVARHECRQRGFKDDLEMMVYPFLEHFLRRTGGSGLPWSQYCEEMRQRSAVEQRRFHQKLVENKLSLRRSARGEPAVAALVAVLKALDATHAREAPPYDVIEGAIQRAWRHEAQQTPTPLSLFECVQQRC